MDEALTTAVVAEDDFLVSNEVVRAAKAAGLTVVAVAADGEEALAEVKRLSPTVALLDIQMPRLTGLEVAHRIREEHPTPVVLLTAYETPEFIQQARDVGVGAYLTKPPNAPALRRAVSIAVARHADLMELLRVNDDLRRVNDELRQALAEVKTLRDLLPICMYCKKICDDEGTWHKLEEYIYENTRTRFSHGMCPDCFEKEMDDI